MTNHPIGIHHFHKRKRINDTDLEPYPHPNKYYNLMDRSIYFIGLIGPVMTIPQVMKIFVEKSIESISLITWITYTFTASFWLFYGIIHKEKPIIFTNTLWVIADLSIVIGTLICKYC
jgi:MtN3 and saliva related transmembrane protein